MPQTAVVYPLDDVRGKRVYRKGGHYSPCLAQQEKRFLELTRKEGEEIFKDLTGENERKDK